MDFFEFERAVHHSPGNVNQGSGIYKISFGFFADEKFDFRAKIEVVLRIAADEAEKLVPIMGMAGFLHHKGDFNKLPIDGKLDLRKVAPAPVERYDRSGNLSMGRPHAWLSDYVFGVFAFRHISGSLLFSKYKAMIDCMKGKVNKKGD
jgi:hypothetical protein